MAELVEEQESQRPDLGRFVGIARRRHLQFLIPLLLGWLLVWSASWVLPPRYKSSTTILVEQPTMPESYVVPNISDDLQTRLQSITTQILSRTRLLMIIDRLHLYQDMGSAATPDSKVDRMRKDIGDVELIRDAQNKDISAFKINYSARNPRVAQEVVGELADLFISENLNTREQESQGTTSFIEKQLADARANLAEQDAKVQQFESQHAGTLPTQQASNLQILAGLQQQLQNQQEGLNTAKQQRVYFQTMLAEEKSAPVKALPALGNAAAAGPTELETVNQQLEKMKAQLADLSLHYTDKYPDVISLKNQIAQTEARRNSLLAAARQKSAPVAAPAGGPDETLSETGRQIESQLQANELEIKNRENAIADVNAKIAEYQARLNAEPSTEQQLADLTRGYDQSKANYDALLKKTSDSEMATSMEEMQQGERFTRLDPPSLPTKPDFPNRLKFCGMGIGVGLALGLVIVGTFEFLDDRMHSEQEIKKCLPVAVVAEVPEAVSPLDEKRARRRAAIGWAATTVVLVTILAGSVFSYLQN